MLREGLMSGSRRCADDPLLLVVRSDPARIHPHRPPAALPAGRFGWRGTTKSFVLRCPLRVATPSAYCPPQAEATSSVEGILQRPHSDRGFRGKRDQPIACGQRRQRDGSSPIAVRVVSEMNRSGGLGDRGMRPSIGPAAAQREADAHAEILAGVVAIRNHFEKVGERNGRLRNPVCGSSSASGYTGWISNPPMPPSFICWSSRKSSAFVTAGPNHHQRIMTRASPGGD